MDLDSKSPTNIKLLMSRLSNYLPLAGGTMTGDIDLLLNSLLTTNHRVEDESSSWFRLRNRGDTDWGNLKIGSVGIYNHIYWQVTAKTVQAANSDDAYIKIMARDNGVGVVEIARLQGGADPSFRIGNDGNVLVGTYGGLIGFFDATPVAQRAKADYNNWAAFTDVVDALVALGLFDTA